MAAQAMRPAERSRDPRPPANRPVVPARDRGRIVEAEARSRQRPAARRRRAAPPQRRWAFPTRARRTDRHAPRRPTSRARAPRARRAPVFKRIDTCAAEFASPRPTCIRPTRAPSRRRAGMREATRPTRKKVIILGGGPNRIGQGIEFDYCCVPRRLCAEGGRLRDHHGQLQSGNRLDRLRHLRPALFRAADRRGRARDHRASSSRTARCSA
jgi:hypothetical protein